MSWSWGFIGNKRNREILGWLGGGLAVVAAAAWALVVYFFPPHTAAGTKPVNVEANCGAVAIGGNVTGTTITGGATSNAGCTAKPK